MKLCDQDIERALAAKQITLTPPVPSDRIHGVSVDLTLANRFRTLTNCNAPYIDLGKKPEEMKKVIDKVMGEEIVIPPDEAFFIHPGELVLGATLESVTLPNDLVGWLDGRSSLARLGLIVHATAHRIDPGWSGMIVLEFINLGKLPLALRPGMVICAINFEKLSGPAAKPYCERANAKYRNQDGPVASKIDVT